VAALAIGVAGAFTSDKTTPIWLLVALFFGGLGLWAGAVVWLFLAHRRMAHVTSGREVRRDGLTVDSALWGRLGVAATALLTVATAVVFVLGIRPDPSHASAYDGQNPNAANCVDTAVTTIVGQDGPVVSDLTGRKVGHVELRASPKCGTIWAKVLFEPTIAPSLNSELIMLVMYRPDDGVRVSYPLRSKGGEGGPPSVAELCSLPQRGQG
jgi:hypothetical protein